MEYAAHIAELDRLLARYIPPRAAWTPVDEAVFGPPDPFRVPPPEAERLQLAALRHAFARHYEGSPFYGGLCRRRGVAPGDIRAPSDLERIPLIPDAFFRDYPEGRDFPAWLGSLVTGGPPQAVPGRRRPSADGAVDAFNRAGLEVTFSSGTSGRLKFVPRDRPTFLALEYSFMKGVVAMLYPHWDPRSRVYLMMPDPRLTAAYAGRSCAVFFDAFAEVRVGLPGRLSARRLRAVTAGGLAGRVAGAAARRRGKKVVADIIGWLMERERGGDKIALVGPPFLLAAVMAELRRRGRTFAFGERGMVGTGGGWKGREGERLPLAAFRAQVEETLGIPGRLCLDGYGMTESNAFLVHCPEGHYLHAPHAFFRPMVLGPDRRPLPYGERGRFAFLDAAAAATPGFILSGDEARLLERCPACDRPGPVLDPEVRRAPGAEAHGCAEEVRRFLAVDLGRGQGRG